MKVERRKDDKGKTIWYYIIDETGSINTDERNKDTKKEASPDVLETTDTKTPYTI